MARTRKTAKAGARKRSAPRRNAAASEAQSVWPITAGIFALVLLVGAAVVFVSMNDATRNSFVSMIDRITPASLTEMPNPPRPPAEIPSMPSTN